MALQDSIRMFKFNQLNFHLIHYSALDYVG